MYLFNYSSNNSYVVLKRTIITKIKVYDYEIIFITFKWLKLNMPQKKSVFFLNK